MLGGWFVDIGSWRIAFATVIPPALLVLAVVARRVPDPPVMRRAPPVDWGAPRWRRSVSSASSAGSSPFGSGVVRLVALAVGGRGTGRVRAARAPHRESDGAAGAVRVARVPRRQLSRPSSCMRASRVCSSCCPSISCRCRATRAPPPARPSCPSRCSSASCRVGSAGSPTGSAASRSSWAGGADGCRPRGLRPSWHRRSVLGTFLVPMLSPASAWRSLSRRLRRVCFDAVEPADAGVASGVNNTAARVGTLLAVAIIGIVALALYSRAIERRLAAAAVPAGVARALVAERRSLADTTIPAWVAPNHGIAATSRRRCLPRRLPGLGTPVCGGRVGRRSDRGHDARGNARRGDRRCHGDADVRARLRPSPPSCPAQVAASSACERATRGCTSAPVLACGHVGCCDSSKNRHATTALLVEPASDRALARTRRGLALVLRR